MCDARLLAHRLRTGHATTNTEQAKHLLPFFDNAYQGYTSGSLTEDAYSVRLFASMGA